MVAVVQSNRLHNFSYSSSWNFPGSRSLHFIEETQKHINIKSQDQLFHLIFLRLSDCSNFLVVGIEELAYLPWRSRLLSLIPKGHPVLTRPDNYILYQIMGNSEGSICGNLQNELKISLSAIHPKYNPNSEYTFKEVRREYLRYPQKYPYILSSMHDNDIKFTDEYFNPLKNEERILGEQFYRSNNIPLIAWQRINDIVKSNPVKINDKIETQSSYRNSNIHNVLLWIVRQERIMKKVFRFEQLNIQGLVLVYFPYFGSQNNPLQIVIDNYVPTNNKKYFAQMKGFATVGMVLLEKALAKLLGSYDKLKNKTGRQIFEIITGIPLVYENVGAQNEIDILSKFYNSSFKISSIQQNLEAFRSSYIKFSLEKRTQVSLSIWQISQNQKENQMTIYSNIIMELILPQNGEYSRVGYSSKLWYNKTVLRSLSPETQNVLSPGKQFLTLYPGDYYLHIFSLSDKHEVRANIIIYSEHGINIIFRKQNSQLNEIKRKMVMNTFAKRYNNPKSQQQFLECGNIKSIFLWDGFRGILSLVNYEANLRKIRLSIQPQYRKNIKLEEDDQSQIKVELVPHMRRIISFVKLINRDIGRFYKVEFADQLTKSSPQTKKIIF